MKKKKASKRMRAAQAARRLIKTFQEARESKTYYEKIREFKPKLQIRHETDDFLVKTAESPQELLQILELRHEIFIWEWQGRKAFHGLDVDEYDFSGDHLMIIDKRIEKVVGTYRFLCSSFTTEFYSDSEFDLARFIAAPGGKMEMGRACVHQDFRDGNTIDLLWKGLSAYIRAANVNYLFGCSSVKTIDPIETGSLYKYLKERDGWCDDFEIRARKKYEFRGFDMENAPPLQIAEAKEMIPPLLRSYLHAGSKVYGWPALDKEFACGDLLTILDLSRLNKKFQARFLEGYNPPSI